MGSLNESEFERRFCEAGKQLENPPRSESRLLKALQKVEAYLSMVNQSPPESMLKAMRPSMDALVNPRLMSNRHSDVKLQILSCLSKIIKITAPDLPYDADPMRDILQLIVRSFQELGKMSSPSFATRVSILKTVAEVRSCVIMLNLGLNDLVVEMFQYFFSAVSKNPNYPTDVYDSMQTIMCSMLDESDSISNELLSVLLLNLTKEKQESSPAAHALARNVVASCAKKLRPYLIENQE